MFDPSPLIVPLLLVATSAVYAASAFRAFQVTRAMVAGIFRSRALWNMGFALLFIPFQFALIPFNFGSGLPRFEVIVAAAFLVTFNLAAFFFCDRAIGAAREMDFFHRDTLGYARLRYSIWTTSAIGMFGSVLLTGPPLLVLILNILWPAPLAYYAVALAATSLRVSDRSIRNYSKWFGCFVGVLAVSFLVLLFLGVAELLVGMLVASLFYYGATASLSPVNRIEMAYLAKGGIVASRSAIG